MPFAKPCEQRAFVNSDLQNLWASLRAYFLILAHELCKSLTPFIPTVVPSLPGMHPEGEDAPGSPRVPWQKEVAWGRTQMVLLRHHPSAAWPRDSACLTHKPTETNFSLKHKDVGCQNGFGMVVSSRRE